MSFQSTVNTALHRLIEPVLRRAGIDDFQTKSNLFAVAFIIPPVIFLIFLMVIPMIYTIGLSVTDVTIFATESNFIGTENYAELYGTNEFWHATQLGIVFALASIVLQISLGLLFAIVLDRKFIGSSLFRTFAIVPYLVPTILVAFMWRWMLDGTIGYVNQMGMQLGLFNEPIPFLQAYELALPTVIGINGWKYISFALLIFLARLQSIDDRMYEQGKINGASTYQMFRDITLPHLLPAILLVALIRFVWMFNKFDTIYLLTRGGPLDATTTLPIYIYEITFFNYELGLGAAAAINMFILLSIIAIAYFKVLNPSEEVETTQ